MTEGSEQDFPENYIDIELDNITEYRLVQHIRRFGVSIIAADHDINNEFKEDLFNEEGFKPLFDAISERRDTTDKIRMLADFYDHILENYTDDNGSITVSLN